MSLDASVSVSYGKKFVARFDVSIPSGGITVIIGPSGGGKSTLLKAVGLTIPNVCGRIVVDEVPVFSDIDNLNLQNYLWARLSLVLQDFKLWPHLTAGANVTLPLRLNRLSEANVSGLYQDFEIEDLQSRLPHELSLGQRQRFALVRAFARGSDYLLLDEPTSALDSVQGRQVYEQVIKAARNGTGVAMVTHDLALADAILAHAPKSKFMFVDDGELRDEGDLVAFRAPSDGRVARFIDRSIYHEPT